MRWRRWATHDPKIAELIKPPRVRYQGADESMAQRTAQRREAADRIRTRAAKLEAGTVVYDILRADRRT